MKRAGTLRVLRLCARQELVLAVRSRWTQIFAGGAVSLVQLVLLLVPPTALLLGVQALASDRGNAELLFSQPVPRGVILLGRVLGLFQALVSAQALGFGAAGLVIYTRAGAEGVSGFLIVVGAGAALTGMCLG